MRLELKNLRVSELTRYLYGMVLHLQCHFGLDTLSWARRGARVTGVDLSSTAIQQAQQLAAQCQLETTFVCSDVYSCQDTLIQAQLASEFDIVFTSYGALVWLPDLVKWAETVAQCLKAGGQFYMVEFHPLQTVLDGYNYFAQDEPDIEEEATYTENSRGETATVICWPHSLADVINALLGAGLTLDKFDEYPYSPYNCFEGLVAGEQVPGEATRYYLHHQGKAVPLTYSIMATKRG